MSRRTNPSMQIKYKWFHNFFACFIPKKKKPRECWQQESREFEEILVQCPATMESRDDAEPPAFQNDGPSLTRSHHIHVFERGSSLYDDENWFEDDGESGPFHCPPNSTGQSSMQEEAPLRHHTRIIVWGEIEEEVPVSDEEEETLLQQHPSDSSGITEEVLPTP